MSDSKVSIECPECQTRYRVDSSRLSGNISKVKCSRCHYIFVPEAIAVSETMSESSSEEDSHSGLQLPVEAEQAYLESVDLTGEAPRKGKPLQDDKKYKFFMKPGESLNASKTAPAQNSSKTAPAQETEIPPVSQKKPEPIATSKDTPVKNKDTEESLYLSEISLSQDESPEHSARFNDTHHYEDDSNDSYENENYSNPERHVPLPVVEEEAWSENPPWGKWTAMLLVGVFLILGVLGGSVYLGLMDTSVFTKMVGNQNHEFEFVSALKGSRIKNEPSRQTLFVIEGRLRNLFDTKQRISWVRLKGLAFDSSRQVIETSIVYAGNVLTEEELTTWSLSKIKDFYKYNSGRDNTNFELSENQEVPFQIVFYNAEGILESTSAKIISYLRKDQEIHVRITEE